MTKKTEKINQMVKKMVSMLLLFLLFTIVLSIEVQAAPKINKKSITLVKGNSCTLKISGTKNKVTWKTGKKAIAKFTDKKKISVKVKAMKVGKTTVTAKLKGKVYKCNVKVVNPELNNSKLTITAGSSATLKVKGGNGKIKWKSSNESIIAVRDGKLTAKKQGTAKVTAIRNGKKMICLVTVKEIDDGISDSENGKKLVEKKIWVVTEMAVEVIKPVYEEVPVIQCLTCGNEFETVEEWEMHEDYHWDNGEEARYTVYAKKTLLGYETTYTEEKGYWKTVYVYE